MALESRLVENLGKLFSLIERNVRLEDSYPPVEGVTVGITRGDTFTLRGDGYVMLSDIAESIAAPAASAVGLSLGASRNLVLSACRQFLEKGSKNAIQWIESQLQSTTPRWTVIRPTALFQRTEEIIIGGCRFRRGLPDAVGEVDGFIRQAFPAFTVAADVEARDQETAELLAEFKIAESLSIVQLSDRKPVGLLGGASLLIKEDGTVVFRPAPPTGAATLDHLVFDSGHLRPYFEPLSATLLTDRTLRTEWEQRTLSAARWLTKALATQWPSDSLISQMVALEALFVPPSWERRKGRKIAQEVCDRWVLRSKTKDEQQIWIEDLYRRRNDAAHQAGAFDDELEVSRLADLTWLSVTWAASHLSPHHRDDGRACQTQVGALSCRP